MLRENNIWLPALRWAIAGGGAAFLAAYYYLNGQASGLAIEQDEELLEQGTSDRSLRQENPETSERIGRFRHTIKDRLFTKSNSSNSPEPDLELSEILADTIDDILTSIRGALIIYDIKYSLEKALPVNLISFEIITYPLQWVTEIRLSRIIEYMESDNSALSLLTCGMLLEGRVPTFVDEDKAPEYYEKRMHDAITFYVKAYEISGGQPKIKDLIEFILWEIKTTNHFDSVRNRLVRYDINPECLSRWNLSSSTCQLPMIRFFRSPNATDNPSIDEPAFPAVMRKTG